MSKSLWEKTSLTFLQGDKEMPNQKYFKFVTDSLYETKCPLPVCSQCSHFHCTHYTLSHYLAHDTFDQKTECKKMRLEVFLCILRQFLPKIYQLSVCTLYCIKSGVINSNPFLSESSYLHYDFPFFPLQSKTRSFSSGQ